MVKNTAKGVNYLMDAEVTRVFTGSIADEAGIVPGDVILSINGVKPRDIIEYKFSCAEEFLEVEIEKQDGEVWMIEIEKDYDEDLGIEFVTDTFDKTLTCRNKCLFCFVDQMAPGMRKSLYVKDDDFRLSFLHGNFITLTNLSATEMKRITKYHLSPMYISVHATDPEVRTKLLNNPKAGEIMTQLKELKRHNIDFHAQIVLCPGYNDGDVLKKSINDLGELLPNLLSLAVVPVGVTKFHTGTMRPVTVNEAKEVIKIIKNAAEDFHKKTGKYIISAADEFYLIADEPIPAAKFYDNFPQYENGVGLTRSFIEDFKKASRKIINFPGRKNDKKYVISGVSGTKALTALMQDFYKRSGITVDIVTVKNEFFGETVTVTGLVTGSDIIKKLSAWRKKFRSRKPQLLLPDCMLKKGEETFLDGITVQDVEDATQTQIKIIETDGAALVKALME